MPRVAKKRTISFQVFDGVYNRIRAACDNRLERIPDYCEHLVSWHTPAGDRETQQLKARIKELESERDQSQGFVIIHK